MPISPAERDAWLNRRNAVKKLKGDAILGTATAPIGGATVASVSDAYVNQQEDIDQDYLFIDSGFGLVPYDPYADEAQGPQGFPITTATEQAIYDAALKAAYTCTDTIPAQVWLSIMQACRKSHSNWKQRRFRLLAQQQMTAANRLAIAADYQKMLDAQQLNGITTPEA